LKRNDFAKTLKEHDELVFSAPLSVSLEITSQCNLRCKYCYTDAGEKQEKELKKKEILDLIDDLYSIGVGTLVFTGGEPLCRPEFFEIARYADEQDFTIILSTNGTLLDAETALTLAESGFNLENLERAGITPFVATTITALNVKGIISLIETICDNTPAQRMRLLRFLPMGRGETARELDVSIDEIKKVYSKIQELRKRIRGPFEINFSDAFNAPFFDRPSHPCIGGHSWCCITPAGYVIPCNYFSSPDVIKILGADSIRKKEFITIWKTSHLLEKFRTPPELKGNCSTCDVSAECRGGCRAVSFSYTGNLFDMGPLCSYRGGT